MLKKVIFFLLLLCLIFSTNSLAENAVETAPSGRPSRGNFDPSQMPKREFDPSQMPSGEFTPPTDDGSRIPAGSQSNGENTNITEQPSSTNPENSDTNSEAPQINQKESQFNGGFPGGMGEFSGNMPNSQQATPPQQPAGFTGFVKTYETPIISVVLLGLAYIFVLLYKRKRY